MAVATATIEMKPSTLARIKNGIKLRDSSILEIAHISSSVCTSTMQLMLPLSQLLPPVSMDIDFTYPSDREIVVWITGRNTVGTSVETESLTAVSVVALAICVLCDPQSEEMSIKRIRLETRSGGYNAGIRQEEDSDY